jgi:hypothetical protein
VSLDTSLFSNGLGEVSEPHFTVTAKNRSQVEFELRAFGLDLVGNEKDVWLVGGSPIDTRLPYVLGFRRSASVSGAYQGLAKALADQGIQSPVVMRGMVRDALGDKFFSEERTTWDFSSFLPPS